jgi:lipopolysaccharide export system protein LptC
MADNLHSTVVAWLKVILPLAALGILSTLFLVARTIDPEDALPFAEVDIEDRLREPRLTMPTWAGVTDDGAALSVTADEARPGTGPDGRALAQQISAQLDMPDGASATLQAATGSLDAAAGVLTVAGGVVVSTSTGYRIETEALTAALDRTRLESGATVTATGPLGRLTAGTMLMTQAAGDTGYVLRFAGGVKLVYGGAN